MHSVRLSFHWQQQERITQVRLEIAIIAPCQIQIEIYCVHPFNVQLPLSFQPVSELFCVRATYTLMDPKNASVSTAEVLLQLDYLRPC